MIIIFIIIVSLIYGSYTDIKTREIPDMLSLGMIYLGVAIACCASLLLWSYKPLLASLIGLGAGALIGLLFYYTGQWGGGDAKVLMGLGSLIGVDLFTIKGGIPDLGVLVINLFVFGALYGLIWIIWLALKHWKTFSPEFKDMRRTKKIIRLRISILSAVLLFGALFYFTKPDFYLMILVVLLMLFAILSLYFFIIIKIVEQKFMIKKVSVTKLTEGDWVIEKVKIKNAEKYIYTKTGISEKGIKMLKLAGKKSVVVKEGVPFVPSFLLAYLITIIFGNWMSFIHL